MRSLNHLGSSPMSLPLSADDIVEFHAARLLLLVDICGTGGRIDGLTKMAKMDFFARYPQFFEVARKAVTTVPPHVFNGHGSPADIGRASCRASAGVFA